MLLGLVISLYSVVALVFGHRRKLRELIESGERGVLAVGVLSSLASASLFYLLLTRDFSVDYVFRHTSTFQPTIYAFSAFWAGQEGSLLLWLWIMSFLGMIAVLNLQGWRQDVQTYALAVIAGIEAVFSLLLVWLSNPFAPAPHLMPEGRGMNPLLENPGMIVHPPTVFVGYAGFSIPFAYAVAALITGRLGEDWLRKVRRWALLAWTFLGVGIVIGAWWAYIELGWGGYWAWDPVENASLIPWLTATAFLHSAVVQTRRRAFKNWTVSLLLATFVLCLFATFVTRSGLIQSVHAFARSPLGYYFLALLILGAVGLTALVLARRRELQSSVEIGSALSREAAFYLVNILFSAGAVVVLFGTLFPTLSQAIVRREIQLGAPFFNRSFLPIAVGIVLLMGLCIALRWRATEARKLLAQELAPLVIAVAVPVVLFALGIREPYPLLGFALVAFVIAGTLAEFYRGIARAIRRKGSFSALLRPPYAGYIVHIGIALIAMGILGSSFYKNEVIVSLKPGESVEVGGYVLTYEDFGHETTPVKERFWALLTATRDGKPVAKLRPEKNFHWNIEQWVTEISLHSTLKEDLYVILAGMEEDGLASFQIQVTPLVIWLWIGGGFILLGGALSFLPRGRG